MRARACRLRQLPVSNDNTDCNRRPITCHVSMFATIGTHALGTAAAPLSLCRSWRDVPRRDETATKLAHVMHLRQLLSKKVFLLRYNIQASYWSLRACVELLLACSVILIKQIVTIQATLSFCVYVRDVIFISLLTPTSGATVCGLNHEMRTTYVEIARSRRPDVEKRWQMLR
jgi:hypothetical protein